MGAGGQPGELILFLANQKMWAVKFCQLSPSFSRPTMHWQLGL
jgi:hypothetical protein